MFQNNLKSPIHGPPLSLLHGHQREVHSLFWCRQGKEEPLTTDKNAMRKKGFLMKKLEPTLGTPDDDAFQRTIERNLATSNTFK